VVASACPHQHEVTFWKHCPFTSTSISCCSITSVEGRSSRILSIRDQSVGRSLAPRRTILSPMADARGHDGFYPLLRQVPLDQAQPLHLSSRFQYPALDRSDLTPYLQFCKFHDFTATMASNSGEVDMETFQRLSDNYQPDVQVRYFSNYKSLLAGPNIDRHLSSATNCRSKL
jgi:hypothetical protein